MRTIALRVVSVRASVGVAGGTLAAAVVAIAGGAGPAAASAPAFSVRYDGRLAVTTTVPYAEGGVGLVTVKADDYATVPITVTSDTAADISIFATGDNTMTDKTLPAGVTAAIAGPGCAFGTNTEPSILPGWGCKVSPGTQTFTATVYISAGSSLAKAGKSVMIISYLDFHNGGPFGYGGYVNVGVGSAVPSVAPTSAATRSAASAPTTTSTRTTSAAPPPPPARSSTTAIPPAPRSSTSSDAIPTTTLSTAATTPSPSPTSSASAAESASTPSATPTPTTPSTSTIAAEPAGHSRPSRTTPIALGAVGTAAAAVAAGAAFYIRRRRAALRRPHP